MCHEPEEEDDGEEDKGDEDQMAAVMVEVPEAEKEKKKKKRKKTEKTSRKRAECSEEDIPEVVEKPEVPPSAPPLPTPDPQGAAAAVAVPEKAAPAAPPLPNPASAAAAPEQSTVDPVNDALRLWQSIDNMCGGVERRAGGRGWERPSQIPVSGLDALLSDGSELGDEPVPAEEALVKSICSQFIQTYRFVAQEMPSEEQLYHSICSNAKILKGDAFRMIEAKDLQSWDGMLREIGENLYHWRAPLVFAYVHLEFVKQLGMFGRRK